MHVLYSYSIHIPAALPWSQWTMWASTPCLSVATQQTRQRTRDRITCVNVNDCEDNCINGTEARTSKLLYVTRSVKTGHVGTQNLTTFFFKLA